MNRQRILILVHLAIAPFLGSCAANALRAKYQPPVAGAVAQSGPSLMVPSFRFKATGVDASNEDGRLLENSLRQTISNTGLYRRIARSSDSAGNDTLSVELGANVDTRYDWRIAWPAAYPLPGYWPIQPYTAKAEIRLKANGSIAGRPFHFDSTRDDSHSEYIYGFYRKEGIAAMLSSNYDDLFLALRDKVASSRREVAAAPLPDTKPARKIRNIAVMPFETPDQSDAALSRVVTNQTLMEFINKGRYQVLEREQIDKILAEQGFQQSGACTSDGCLVQVGQLLGVDAMVSGVISRLGELIVVSVRVTDVEQGRILFATQVQTDKGIGHLLSVDLKDIAERF